jgi:potassium efflux system protein
MRNNRRNLTGLLFLAMLALVPAAGQAPATNAAPSGSSTPAPVAAAAVPLVEVVTAAVTDSQQVQDVQTHLVADPTAAEVSANLPVLEKEIDQREKEDRSLLARNPSIPALRTATASWELLSTGLGDAKQSLASRITALDGQLATLTQMSGKWQATLTQSTGAPAAVTDRIHAVVGGIAQATKTATSLRARLLSLQNSAAELDSRISAGLATIKSAQESAVNMLFTRDSAPLWDVHGRPAPAGSTEDPLAAQLAGLRAYVVLKFPTFFIHLGLFLIFALALFWARNEMRARAQDDPDLVRAAAVFEVPLATAMLLTLLISGWLYPLPPPIFVALLGAIAILPTVLLLRRLLEPALYPVLYALLVLYFVSELRMVITGATWTGRLLFLGELAAACLFLVWLLRRALRPAHPSGNAAQEKFVRIYARFALLLLAAAVLVNALGYVRLSYLLGTGVLKSSYLLMIFYAALRIAEGLLITALKFPPFSLLSMARSHYPILRRRLTRVLRWVIFLSWLWITLDLFSVGAPIARLGNRAFRHQVKFGSVPLSLEPLLYFGLTIWGTVLLSKFLRFVLEQEIYPKLHLAPGVPYTASRLVHYTVLVVGVIFALAAMGIDLRQYTVLAGALGVGLGFGLQNIMNNFVSGIILLFERPIKVGDVIQVDTNVGTVESIGIRASVIRITNGSELIMPNGNLISNPVTNWTFSNRQRAIDLPVSVAAKSDPRQVMALLVETARAHPLVLKAPPPQALLTNLSGASLNFELRVWTGNNDGWTQVRSDLALAISTALARENIAVS